MTDMHDWFKAEIRFNKETKQLDVSLLLDTGPYYMSESWPPSGGIGMLQSYASGVGSGSCYPSFVQIGPEPPIEHQGRLSLIEATQVMTGKKTVT